MAKSKCKLPEWGEEDVRRFFSRFEMCCDLNAWVTDKDKVGQLVPLLSDKVFDFVCGLSETDRSKYDTVIEINYNAFRVSVSLQYCNNY